MRPRGPPSRRGGPPPAAAPVDGGSVSTFVAHAQHGEVVPPDIDEVEHMCALLTACDRLPIPPSFIPADFQSCVAKMSSEMTSVSAIDFSLTMRECGLQSNSCAALRSCALHGASAEACSGRGKQNVVGYCDVDGRALECWHEQVLGVRDCSRGGDQCIVAGGNATCTPAPCPADIPDGDPARCSASGTHLLRCAKGKLASLDCAAFGLKCAVGGDGTSGCATGGAACSGASTRCDGNTAVGCLNGHEVRVECGRAGLQCRSSPGSVAVGACYSPPPPAGACDPAEKARCDGATIKYCNAGSPRSYFCKALGFPRCDSSRSGPRCL